MGTTTGKCCFGPRVEFPKLKRRASVACSEKNKPHPQSSHAPPPKLLKLDPYMYLFKRNDVQKLQERDSPLEEKYVLCVACCCDANLFTSLLQGFYCIFKSGYGSLHWIQSMPENYVLQGCQANSENEKKANRNLRFQKIIQLALSSATPTTWLKKITESVVHLRKHTCSFLIQHCNGFEFKARVPPKHAWSLKSRYPLQAEPDSHILAPRAATVSLWAKLRAAMLRSGKAYDLTLRAATVSLWACFLASFFCMCEQE